MTTKEKILQESMRLFSIQGFNTVSVRTIAGAVGVRDSALYKHFKSKQEIFEALVKVSKERFLQKYKKVTLEEMDFENIVPLCMKMFEFQTEDEWIVMFRRMLIVEQFNNLQMAKIYKELFVDMPINYQTEVFRQLIAQDVMEDKDARVMAMELYAPFFLYHTIQEDPNYIRPLLKLHIENFFASYMKQLK